MRSLGRVTVVALVGLVFFAGGTAIASPGCTALQGSSSLAQGTVGQIGGSGFEAGDTIKLTFTKDPGDADPADYGLVRMGAAGFQLLRPLQAANFTYVVPEDTPDLIGLRLSVGSDTAIAVWSCTPAPKGNRIEQIRRTFSRLAAETSSNAMGDSVGGAITDALSSGGTTQFGGNRISTSFAALNNARASDTKKDDERAAFAALGYDKAMVTKAMPRGAAPAPSLWHAWIDGRFTGLQDRDHRTASFDGHHTHLTGGLSYRFSGTFVAGLVAGYEDFKYDVSGDSLFLKGSGRHGGGYFGWKFWDRLRLDGMLTYGRIDYGAQDNLITAGFGADRITGMARLSGRYGMGTYYLEPSARVTLAHERQAAFNDSAGIQHPTYDFTVGRASFGGEAGVPILWNDTVVTPTLGLFGDYRFGVETVSTIAVVPTLADGWSARVTGGLSWQTVRGVTASLGGEYGGLAGDVRYWRARTSLGVKF
ncbi:MAG: autotransporter outer membrane beta-barrel domain-containing protein [Afipia sp.]|nr:autotransporter outer membrane beta-barrel domain-containing protein [Afipia sp.]